MSKQWIGLATAIALIVSVPSNWVKADSMTNAGQLPPEVKALIHRLEKAESEIKELRQQLKDNDTQTLEAIADEKAVKKDDAKKDDKAKKEAKKKDEKLDKLAKEWEAFQKKEKAAADKAKKKPSISWAGRIHLDYVNFASASEGIGEFEGTPPDPEDRITFRRLRFTAKGKFADNMFYKLQTEFGDPNDFAIRDALMGFDNLPIVQTLIVGNQKRPISLDQWNSSNDNVFQERPTIADAFNEEARRIGICSYNHNEAESINWQYGVYILEDVANDGSAFGDAYQLSFNTRVSGTPWYDEASGGRGYLHLGIANQISNPDPNIPMANTRETQVTRFRSRPELRSSQRWINTDFITDAEFYNVAGLEAVLNLGSLAIVSEYMANYVSRAQGDDCFFHGWYIYAAYFLTGEHQPFDRAQGKLDRPQPFENFFLFNRCCGRTGGGWGAWQVAARYSYIDLTDNDILGGVENNFTLGLNWWWNSSSRLMFNYVTGDIIGRNPADFNGFSSGNFGAWTCRFQFVW